MDREAWRAAIHGVAKSWTWLSDWTELNWNHCRWRLQPWNKKTLLGRKAMKNLDSKLKKAYILKIWHCFANKFPTSQSYGFSSSYEWMWVLCYKKSWASQNWCFWTVVLKKTLKGLLYCKNIQPVYPKGNQSLVFIGRTGAEAETPILCPPDAKNCHLKRPWSWERLNVGGQGDNRVWDDCVASLT